MDSSLVVVLLLALAGFLIGGAYSVWKTAKVVAVVLGVAALLAIGGAVAWLYS